MTGVRLELTGSEEALAVLGDAAGRADKPRELYDQVGASLVVSTQMRFEREQDPDGNPWPASLRALTTGGRTLTDSARLVQSITHNPNDAGVEIGTNVIYAAIHQQGGVIRAKTSKGLRFRGPGNGGWITKQEVTIPQRAFLGVDDEDEDEIGALAGTWLLGENGDRSAGSGSTGASDGGR